MDEAAKRNNAAKAAIETRSVRRRRQDARCARPCSLLGGVVRDSVPVLWTLASGDPGAGDRGSGKQDRRPAAQHIQGQDRRSCAGSRHGAACAASPRALEGRATLIVDANQAWDETTALRCLPILAEIGVTPGRAALAGLEHCRAWLACAPGPPFR